MPPRRTIKGTHALVVLGAILLIAAIGALIAVRSHSSYKPQLDDFGLVPSFAFTDETGRRFPTEAMAGQVTIVDFVFTRCDTICPALTGKMLEVQERTADLGDRIGMVSFTVDPTHDTPAVLARYAKDFHADPQRWRFVTGELAKLIPIVEGAFMAGVDDLGTTPSGAPNINHIDKFFLVDQNLQIRQFYATDSPGIDRLIRDARYLAKHPPKVTPGSAPRSASAR